MVKSQDHVVWLSDIDAEDYFYVGRKAADLGEIVRAKFPVPHGFVITSEAYCSFVKKNRLDVKIKHLLNTVNYESSESIQQVSAHIKKIITTSEVPEDIVQVIFSFYEKLCRGKKIYVAVRSSASGEDSKQASFAGQQSTFLNICGDAALIEKVRQAWASLFEARALFYRHESRFDNFQVGMSLIVQKMVAAEISGTLFTLDPINSDKSKIIIEAVWGLGEYMMQGKETPDHYEIDKKNFKILTKEISSQTLMLQMVKGENQEILVPRKLVNIQKLRDHEIVALAKIGEKIEKHYYFPQDIEWAMENGNIFVVQTRPISTLAELKSYPHIIARAAKRLLKKPGVPILVGDPASVGIGIGPVRIIENASQLVKVKVGDILVAPFITPDYVLALKRAAGIITERGGRTSHAAILAREFGIPAVVGAPRVLKLLREDDIVTINGKTGEIFKGSIARGKVSKNSVHTLKTRTRVYVNVPEPELAEEIMQKNIDGVGLLRAEIMVQEMGIHPKKMVQDGKGKEFVNMLADGIEVVCRAVYPLPVYYRAIDFTTEEFRALSGGKEFETVEANPMLGYRGAFRYITDPVIFKMQLAAIKKVRHKKGFNNLHLMIPFVRTPRELGELKKIMIDQGLRRSRTFKLVLLAEIPSNVIMLEEFIKVGIDGISIGSNDLTMLLLGVDRDNHDMITAFDERNEAVLWSIEKMIKTAKKHKIESSLCGQVASLFPDVVEKLVEWGISYVSVEPGAVEITRDIIYEAEQKIHPGLRD